MKYVISVLIFCVVLFFYLHINHHLHKSNDLEIFTIENPSKDKLEEICNLRQPVLFDYINPSILDECTLNSLNNKYAAFDIKLRDTQNTDEKSELYLPFVLKESIDLFNNDKDKKYITENNYDFLEETGAIKHYSYNDEFLRPPLVSKCDYDIMSGTIDSYTPLRYNLNYRNYYYVTSGSVNIKLIPPLNSKYLLEKKDYENFEFRSPMNPWAIQEKYESEYNKVKSLDIKLSKGTMLYIPAYWWYSIKYDGLASVAVFYYKTVMNQMAITPETIMNLLQEQNIKRINFDNFKLNLPGNNINNIIDENATNQEIDTCEMTQEFNESTMNKGIDANVVNQGIDANAVNQGIENAMNQGIENAMNRGIDANAVNQGIDVNAINQGIEKNINFSADIKSNEINLNL